MDSAASYTVAASSCQGRSSQGIAAKVTAAFVAIVTAITFAGAAASASVRNENVARCSSLSIDVNLQIASCTVLMASHTIPRETLALVTYDRAIGYSRASNYDAAIADFTAAAKLGLTKNVYYFRALAHFNKQEFRQAIADDTLAIAVDPASSDAYNNRGTAHFDLGEYALSVADYDAAIKAKPDNEMAYVNRGNAYRSMGRDDEAIADFDRAIALNPKDEGAFVKRGLAYSHKGEYLRALTDYNLAFGRALVEARSQLPGAKHDH